VKCKTPALAGKAVLNSFFLFSLFSCFLLQLRRRRCSSGECPARRRGGELPGRGAGGRGDTQQHLQPCPASGCRRLRLFWGAGVTSSRRDRKIVRGFPADLVRGARQGSAPAARVGWCTLVGRGAGTWGLSSWWPWPWMREAGAVPECPHLQQGPRRLPGARAVVPCRQHALTPSPPPRRTRRPRKANASLSSSYPTSQGLLSLSLSLILSPPLDES